MMAKRRTHTANFKFKVAREALREQEPLSQLASRFGVSPNQISTWKGELLKQGSSLFERSNKASKKDDNQELTDSLYRKIGELEMKLDWAKKKGLLE